MIRLSGIRSQEGKMQASFLLPPLYSGVEGAWGEVGGAFKRKNREKPGLHFKQPQSHNMPFRTGSRRVPSLRRPLWVQQYACQLCLALSCE